MTKTIVLFRHAKSSWKDTDLSDYERPLKKRGRNDAALMGRVLRNKLPQPQRMLASPSVRTRQTAEYFLPELGCSPTVLHWEEQLYLADPRTIQYFIGQQPSTISQLWVLGHNPGLTELANLLCPEQALENLPTSAVFAVKAAIEKWADLSPQKCTFHLFDKPKFYK